MVWLTKSNDSEALAWEGFSHLVLLAIKTFPPGGTWWSLKDHPSHLPAATWWSFSPRCCWPRWRGGGISCDSTVTASVTPLLEISPTVAKGGCAKNLGLYGFAGWRPIILALPGTCCPPGCTCTHTASSFPPPWRSSTSTPATHLTPQKMQRGRRGTLCVPSTRLTLTFTMKHCHGTNWISSHLYRSLRLTCRQRSVNLCCEVTVGPNEKCVTISERAGWPGGPLGHSGGLPSPPPSTSQPLPTPMRKATSGQISSKVLWLLYQNSEL